MAKSIRKWKIATLFATLLSLVAYLVFIFTGGGYSSPSVPPNSPDPDLPWLPENIPEVLPPYSGPSIDETIFWESIVYGDTYNFDAFYNLFMEEFTTNHKYYASDDSVIWFDFYTIDNWVQIQITHEQTGYFEYSFYLNNEYN